MKQLGYGPLQTFRVSRPGDAYLHRATEAFGMRRGGRQGHFLAGVIGATTGLGLCGEGLAMAIAPRHPVVGQVLFFIALTYMLSGVIARLVFAVRRSPQGVPAQ